MITDRRSGKRDTSSRSPSGGIVAQVDCCLKLIFPEQHSSVFPLQAIKQLDDFQQCTLIVRRQGAEMLAELDGFFR